MTDENKVPKEINGTNVEKKQNTRKRRSYNKNIKTTPVEVVEKTETVQIQEVKKQNTKTMLMQ